MSWRCRIQYTLAVVVLLAPTVAQAKGETATLRIYLARHGQTDWNAAHRLQGNTNTHLNATGREQATALAARLAGVHFEHAYCSRLSRTQETAAILLTGRHVPIDSLAGLNEQNFGRFQGLRTDTSDAIAAEWRRRSADPTDSLDGGESLEMLSARVSATVERIRHRHKGGNILIVGHGGSNKMVLLDLFHLTMEQADSIQQGNDELYLIEMDATGPPRLFKLIAEGNLKEL